MVKETLKSWDYVMEHFCISIRSPRNGHMSGFLRLFFTLCKFTFRHVANQDKSKQTLSCTGMFVSIVRTVLKKFIQ